MHRYLGHRVPLRVRGQPVGDSSLPLPYGSWKSNSDNQTWATSTFTGWSSCQPSVGLINFYLDYLHCILHKSIKLNRSQSPNHCSMASWTWAPVQHSGWETAGHAHVDRHTGSVVPNLRGKIKPALVRPVTLLTNCLSQRSSTTSGVRSWAQSVHTAHLWNPAFQILQHVTARG